MEFWIGLVIISIIYVLIVFNIDSEYKKILTGLYMIILWFLSSFRYMIGWDYESYSFLYDFVNIGDIYPEQSFILTSVFFREQGFDYQILFVFYGLITYVYLWKAVQYYCNSCNEIIIALLFFMLHTGLYFDSFSVVRQFAAVSIFLYGTRYIVEKNIWKFILYVIWAGVWHQSVLVLLPVYFILNMKFKKKTYFIGGFIAMLIAVSAILSNVVEGLLVILSSTLGLPYIGYMDVIKSLELFNGVLGFFSLCIIYFIIANAKTSYDKKERLIKNACWMAALIITMLSFSQPLFRLSTYFLVFVPLFFARVYVAASRKILYNLILLCMVMIFLYHIYTIPMSIDGIIGGVSASNINYEFNFKLLK